MDGTNNFRDSYSPSLGLIVMREFGDHGAFYLEPIGRTTATWRGGRSSSTTTTRSCSALGTRIRLRPTTYVVVEVVPRVSGYKKDEHPVSFAVEKRVGGHAFQLVFSNTSA